MKRLINKYMFSTYHNKVTRSIRGRRLSMAIMIMAMLLTGWNAQAALTLPHIPTNEQFSNLYEFSAEYVYRVKLDANYLETGAIIAYVGDEIRGAQTASVLFPGSGLQVYKVRVHSNLASGENVTFKYYDVFNDKIYEVTEMEPFVANALPDYSTPATLNAFCNNPTAPTGLIPADAAVDLNATVDLFWQATSNTSYYNLFIWKDGMPEPSAAYRSKIGNTTTRVYNLEYGTKYRWKVVSQNLCASKESVVQEFTTRELPDLVITSVSAPANLVSATPFNFNYTVKNVGVGTTSATAWYDGIYVSPDSVARNNVKYLGRVVRPNTLASGAQYSQTFTTSLPHSYAGTYYIFVKTDMYNNQPEVLNSNNGWFTPFDTVEVSLIDLPDIMVKDIVLDKTSALPGDKVLISWSVKNIGKAIASGGWTTRVALVSGTGSKSYLSGSPAYNGSVAIGDSATQAYLFTLPTNINFSGDVDVQVELFPRSQLVEHDFNKDNNKALASNKLNLGSILNLTIPNSVSEAYTGSLRCYVTRTGNNVTELPVTLTSVTGGHINVPTNLTIPSGSASKVFYITVNDNSLLDGDRDIDITASATGFVDTTKALTVLDDEVASLDVSLSKKSLNEGDVLTATISRDLVTSSPLPVNLSTNKNSQWTFASSATIPANQASVDVEVTVVDNDVPEIDVEAILTASSAGLNADKDTAIIFDDDLTTFEFEILSDTVSEAAGPYAAWAVVRRTGGSTGMLRIRLAVNIAGMVYYPSSVNLNEGVGEKRFNIGTVDNGLVDGYRSAVITASQYLPSCRCTTTETNGGIKKDTLVLVDNDGPTLSLTVDPLSLAEGLTNAGKLRVQRNTPQGAPLVVKLSHDDDTEIALPATATIPSDADFIDVPIQSLDDGVDDGDQTVNINATADGFTPGFVWVLVTDQNKPDLQVPSVTLEDDTAIAEGQLLVEALILNDGYLTAPSGVKVNVYLSEDATWDEGDEILGEYKLEEAIPVGGTANFLELIPVPATTGTFNVIVKVNPDSDVGELLYINNESTPTDLEILPNYNGTAIVDDLIFNSPQSITIYGAAKFLDGTEASNKELDVYILSNGTRRTLTVTTDGAGNYSTEFSPNNFEAGHYMIGACYPDQGLNDVQDEFDILGMSRSNTGHLIWDIKLNVPVSGTIEMKNLSNIDLNEISFVPIDTPDGFELVIDTINVLPGAGKASFNFTITGTELTQGTQYVRVPIEVRSAEGIVHSFTLFYYCQALQAHLKAIPSSINTTMIKGQTRLYEVLLFNDGAGETGEVEILLPDVSWMSLATPSKLVTIESGDTVAVILELTPDDDTPLNTPISGTIAVNVAVGKGVSIPYRIETVSEETGSLTIDVVDDYFYNTEEAPHLKGAHVVVRHPFTGVKIAEGFTDSLGIFKVDTIKEGKYTLTIEADKHEGYQNTIVVDPGRENAMQIYLQFQAITYTWEVVPTEIEDEYEIELILEFETNVPAPVVIMEMPKSMPQLFGSQTYPFLITLTNKGLITAQNVKLNLPSDDPEYEWVTNFQTVDILAQQAIQVPVVMRRKDAFKSASLNTWSDPSNYGTPVKHTVKTKAAALAQSSGPCGNSATVEFSWPCGDNDNTGGSGASFTMEGRSCGGTGTGDPFGGGYCCGGGYPSRGGGGDGGYGPSSYTPSTTTSFDLCNSCLVDVALAAAGCYPPTAVGASIAACLWSARDGVSGEDVANCIIGFTPYGCACGVAGALDSCFPGLGLGTCGSPPPPIPPLPSLRSAALAEAAGAGISPILVKAVKELVYVDNYYTYLRRYMTEYVGTLDWESKENFNDFLALTNVFQVDSLPYLSGDILLLKSAMSGTDISEEEIDAFCLRWNLTLEAKAKGIYTPNAEYPDIIDTTIINKALDDALQTEAYANASGYSSVQDMYNISKQAMDEQLENENSSVCASVTISIKQKLTMTREAFEGTLTIFNGHDSDPMEDIEIDLVIKNDKGEIANDLFEIETKALDVLTGIDGTGTLKAQEKGSATILFIPEKGAAPEVPRSYSFGGTFSYKDPFSGLKVTKDLFPVTLDVHPSPDLYLHYFMQRDILGDDALTEPIEPIVPAELALMIENNGFGTAKKVTVESAQPVIVDNEKGLSIHFELIGSNLQGQETNLGLIDIDFGNIEPKKTKIGQWWFTSTLLGHFINYEAKVTHLDSRGNPDLSLVSGATLHELIHSIRVYGGTDDGINDFLVNEVQDKDELPDAIYMSQGQTVLDVHPATSGMFTGNIRPTYLNTLSVTPSRLGWNYIKLNDPGNGLYEVESVTRLSDNQVIPLDNIWQTHVTIPDGKEPIYERKIHFVDLFENIGTPETYGVKWKVKDPTPVRIVSIEGTPSTMVTEQVKKLTVKFNKEIDESTFTYEDMSLRLQGGDELMDNTVGITKIDGMTYEIDLSTLTIGSGYYVLNVQAAEVYDNTGTSGAVGMQAAWTQFISVPAVQEFVGLTNDTVIKSTFDDLVVRFNLALNPSTVVPARFILTRDGNPVTGTLSITPLDADGRLFNLSGLKAMMTVDGEYKLTVDLPNIETDTGEKGILQQHISWTVDTTIPDISQLIRSSNGGFDAQHTTVMGVMFTEPVRGLTMANVKLWKDGLQQPLSQVHLDSVAPDKVELSQFRLITYYEGAYRLVIDKTGISDAAGNFGSGEEVYQWVVDRTAPPAVHNLRVTPDLGFSNTDGITSTRSLNAIMEVMEEGTTIELYENDGVTRNLLKKVENVPLGELTVPLTFSYPGGVSLEVLCIDPDNNFATSNLELFIDETALQGDWTGAPAEPASSHPDTVTIEFSSELLEGNVPRGILSLQHKGATLALDGVSIKKESDKMFKVIGFKQMDSVAGAYELGIDLSQLHKYKSGKSGEQVSTVTWNIKDANRAPIAHAGKDLVVIQSSTYWLNATQSSDPDGDLLTYQWYGPDGIDLINPTQARPYFKVPKDSVGTKYEFLVSVSDGDFTSTDKVIAEIQYVVQIAPLKDDEDLTIVLYPVPAKSYLYLEPGEKAVESVSLIDHAGRTVYNEKGNGKQMLRIDVNPFASGFYTVRIILEDAIVTRKVVIHND